MRLSPAQSATFLSSKRGSSVLSTVLSHTHTRIASLVVEVELASRAVFGLEPVPIFFFGGAEASQLEPPRLPLLASSPQPTKKKLWHRYTKAHWLQSIRAFACLDRQRPCCYEAVPRSIKFGIIMLAGLHRWPIELRFSHTCLLPCYCPIPSFPHLCTADCRSHPTVITVSCNQKSHLSSDAVLIQAMEQVKAAVSFLGFC